MQSARPKGLVRSKTSVDLTALYHRKEPPKKISASATLDILKAFDADAPLDLECSRDESMSFETLFVGTQRASLSTFTIPSAFHDARME